MKADRNQIQNYNISKYIEWLISFPTDLVYNISEWLRLRHIEDYLLAELK